MVNKLTAHDLLVRILRGGGNFMGTIHEMELFIKKTPDKFPQAQKLKQGDWVDFWDTESKRMKQGRFQYEGVNERRGKMIIVVSGIIYFVLPENITKIYRD